MWRPCLSANLLEFCRMEGSRGFRMLPTYWNFGNGLLGGGRCFLFFIYIICFLTMRPASPCVALRSYYSFDPISMSCRLSRMTFMNCRTISRRGRKKFTIHPTLLATCAEFGSDSVSNRFWWFLDFLLTMVVGLSWKRFDFISKRSVLMEASLTVSPLAIWNREQTGSRQPLSHVSELLVSRPPLPTGWLISRGFPPSKDHFFHRFSLAPLFFPNRTLRYGEP